VAVVAQSCVNVVFELALSKYKQPIPRNSFNLRYRLNHTITLLQTYFTELVASICFRILSVSFSSLVAGG
jgi:hypothetical protein